MTRGGEEETKQEKIKRSFKEHNIRGGGEERRRHA